MQLNVNGLDVFAATGGKPFDPAQPAVVLLHGAGMDHTGLGAARPLVRASRLFGAGAGSAGPRPLGRRAAKTIADMADWTAALVAAGGAKAKLVGHSMGSLIALETAARHPAKVSALT